MSDLKNVFSNIRNSGSLPILFVGSGISKRYTTNDYKWDELLIRCIAEYESDPVRKYKAYEMQARRQAANSENSEEVLTRIGSMIEYDFNMSVYNGKIHMDVSVENSVSPLKRFLSNLLSGYNIKEEMMDEINLLKKLSKKMLTVVTTNYDTFLEDHIFTTHTRVTGTPIFLGGEIGTLLKMHGCVTEPESIILTREDYVRMERRSKVLVGKLIHLFTENPVIFLGYSLTDVSVQRLLVDIFSCVESPYDFKRLKERLIYVEYDKKESGVDIGDLIKDVDGRSIHMTKIRLSNYMVLLEHMSEMEKITKLKEVLWLKDLVQNLVVNYQGSKTKIIQMSDDSEDYSGDEVVVAIGKEKDIPDTLQERGLLGLEGDDIFRDIVFNDMPTVSSKESLLKALEKLSHRNSRTLPVHKYLKGFQGEIPPVLQEIQSKGPEDILSRTIKKDRPMFDEFFAQNPEISFEEIYQSSLPNVRKSNFLVLKAALHADAQELREFLERRFHDIPNSSFAPELSL